MTIDYTREALADLDGIWDWNALKYTEDHANSYIKFLYEQTDKLITEYTRGGTVSLNSKLRYVIAQRRAGGHGHIIVYEITKDVVIRILRYFHTAEDWRTKLASGRRQ